MQTIHEMTEWQLEAWQDTTPELLFSGGLGAGKTANAGSWTVLQAFVLPGSRGAISAPTYDQLIGSTYLELRRMCEKKGIRHQLDRVTNEVRLSNGSSLRLVTHATAPMLLKSYEYDWGHEDEGDAVDEESHRIFSDRFGRSRHAMHEARARDLNIPVERIGLFRVSCNPVPYGHHLYRIYKQEATEAHGLWEIPTYANRRNLADGYIEKLEARYPRGTALYRKWLLGQCGIPSDRAVFSEFQSDRDAITSQEFASARVVDWLQAVHLSVGAVGYLLCARLKDGTVVATDEVLHRSRAPEDTMKAATQAATARHARGTVICDRDDELSREYRGLRLVHMRAPQRVGYSRLAALIAEGRFKLLLDDNGEPLCRELRNQLDTHEKLEGTNEPENRNRELVLPATYIAGAARSGLTEEGIRKSGLRGVVAELTGGGDAGG